MNPSRVDQPVIRFVPWLALRVLVTGLGLTGLASGAEATFGLYKSTDRGASWFQADQGLPSDARINALSMVGERVVAGTDRGMFTSRDAGAEWQPSRKGVGTDSRVLCLTAHAGRVFAGTQKHGVLSSDDEGLTWNAMNTGLTDLYVRSLLAVGTRLYAGTDSQGVFVVGIAGGSWASQRTGLPDSSQVFDLASLDGTLFAALYSQGLYRWDPDRARWARAGDVAPLEIVVAGRTLVVGHNPGGVFVSEDEGKSWQDGNLGLPVRAPIWALATGDDLILVGTSGQIGLGPDEIGLFASTDRGRSWARSDAGLPPASAAVSFVVTKGFTLAGIVSRRHPGGERPR